MYESWLLIIKSILSRHLQFDPAEQISPLSAASQPLIAAARMNASMCCLGETGGALLSTEPSLTPCRRKKKKRAESGGALLSTEPTPMQCRKKEKKREGFLTINLSRLIHSYRLSLLFVSRCGFRGDAWCVSDGLISERDNWKVPHVSLKFVAAFQPGSGVLATHPLVHSALTRWTLAIGSRESKMATSKTKSISAFFGPAKRLRVDAEPDARLAHELTKTASITTKVRNVSTTAKASDGFDLHPLPGFEPPPFRGVNQQQSALQETEEAATMVQQPNETVSDLEKGPEMTKELKMRMELNKTIARAKRNLRACEEHIAESQRLDRSFPDFQKLLVEQSWLDVVQDEFTKQYMNTLHTFVQQESAGKLPIYPPLPLIFNAFNTCPFDKVKVVIIGQDPYHGPGQAIGLSFSVPKGTKIPSSLVNIFKEIRDDVGATIPSHGDLEKWAHQGVLMLNAVLTVREHHANSHAKKGWEPFTDAVIRAVSQKRKGVVFLLWGNSAQDKTRLIDTKQHHILKAAHPSGLSAHKGFFNCRHFSKTNQILEKAGEFPIDWQL